MKKLLIILPILIIAFAGCEILGPDVNDHSDDVAGPYDGSIYDRDVLTADAGSGFVFYDDGGTDTTMNGTADVIDMYYDNVNLTLSFVGPEGDPSNYVVTDTTKILKQTKFAAVSETITDIDDDLIDLAAPATMTLEKITIEDDGWYWIKLDNTNETRETEYVLLHITAIGAAEDQVDFEFWCQNDGTRFFGEEQD